MNLDTTTLERLTVTAQEVVPAEYRASAHVDHIMGGLALRLERFVWATKIGEELESWPADWWEAVKERWFPTWALHRWPVRYRHLSLKAYHAYPTMNLQHHRPALHFQHFTYTDAKPGEGE